jgi:ABC-type transport system substrate-binding protein
LEENAVKRHKLFAVLGGLVVLSMVLAACGTPTTAAPAPTSPPAAEEPTAVPMPENPYATVPFTEPMVLTNPECVSPQLVKSVEAVDEFTVVFNLCQSDPAFLSKMGFSVFGIYPQEWLEWATKPENQEARLSHPVGTGPYMVQNWARGESLTFAANPNYWGTRPTMDACSAGRPNPRSHVELQARSTASTTPG